MRDDSYHTTNFDMDHTQIRTKISATDTPALHFTTSLNIPDMTRNNDKNYPSIMCSVYAHCYIWCSSIPNISGF